MNETQAKCQKIDSEALEQAVEKALYKMFTAPVDLSLLVNELTRKTQYDIVCQMMQQAQVTLNFHNVPDNKQELLKALSALLDYVHISYKFKPFQTTVVEK